VIRTFVDTDVLFSHLGGVRKARGIAHSSTVACVKHMTNPRPEFLVSPSDLHERLGDPRLVVLDLRQPELYANGHVPRARSLDIFGVSLIDTRPDPLRAFLWIMEHLIAAKGVNADSRVVVYDAISGERAARLFWFLEFFGHDAVEMLDGGFTAWEAAGFPVAHKAEPAAHGTFKARPRRERLATADDILARLGDRETAIVDARSAAENRGDLVRSAHGGRIPGAVHLEWKENLDAEGRFKSPEALRAQYAGIGVTPDREVIPYCQGGYRSANTYVALRIAGYPRIRNYLGSWGEWGNREGLPIET
jgi:thiosulfate/3-mercaptopyruvate sulfurtransferase